MQIIQNFSHAMRSEQRTWTKSLVTLVFRAVNTAMSGLVVGSIDSGNSIVINPQAYLCAETPIFA